MLTGIDRFEVRVYNKAGTQQAYASSTGGGGWIASAKFTLARIGGCTTATIKAPRPGIPGTVACGHLLEFWVKPRGGTLARYWRGEVIECPNTGNTADVLEYRARGLMAQLSDKLILKYYSGAAIDTMLTAASPTGLIKSEFIINTDIADDVTEVSLSSAYTLGDAEFEFTTGAQALKALADAQKLVDYGVDQDGAVYFKDRDLTTVVERYWVGKHLASYETADNAEKIMNSVLIQSKEVVSGGMLTIAKSDSTSVTAYGERMELREVPELKDADDVYRLSEGLVADEKDPRTAVDADVLLSFADFHFPTGAVVVTDIDGNTATLPIQKTIYTLDADGFRGRFELGDEPVLAVDTELQAIMRKIDVAKQSNISLTKIDHTRGEEWRQLAIVDARKQGHYNSWFSSFESKQGFSGWAVHHIADGAFVGCSWDRSGATYISPTIPLGPTEATHSGTDVDSVRIHVDQDWYGRLSFEYDSDLDYFNGATTAWKPRDSYAQLEPTNATDYIYYKDDAAVFAIPTSGDFNVKIGVKDMRANETNNFDLLIFESAFNFWEVRCTNGTANFTAQLYKRSGTPAEALVGTVTATKDTDYQIELSYRETPENTTLKVYDYDGVQAGTTVTDAGGSPDITPTQVGVDGFYQGGNVLAYLDYFELQDCGTITLSVSRDGGTTWTDSLLNAGDTFKTVDVSGQPSGNELILKATITHPCRLYGWGASWQ